MTTFSKTLIAGVLAIGGALNLSAADLSAKIPFAFQLNGKSLPAGEYFVVTNTQANTVRFLHRETGNAAIKLITSTQVASSANSLVFECAAGKECTFTEVSDKPATAIKVTENQKVVFLAAR